jgi:hypothetical protein
MTRGKKNTPEQIVSLLRQVEVAAASAADASDLLQTGLSKLPDTSSWAKLHSTRRGSPDKNRRFFRIESGCLNMVGVAFHRALAPPSPQPKCSS